MIFITNILLQYNCGLLSDSNYSSIWHCYKKSYSQQQLYHFYRGKGINQSKFSITSSIQSYPGVFLINFPPISHIKFIKIKEQHFAHLPVLQKLFVQEITLKYRNFLKTKRNWENACVISFRELIYLVLQILVY